MFNTEVTTCYSPITLLRCYGKVLSPFLLRYCAIMARSVLSPSFLLGNLSTGRFRGNGNFSDRKSLGRKQRRSRQNINVKQQTKFAAATSVANSVRC